jgi:hypothetical protein
MPGRHRPHGLDLFLMNLIAAMPLSAEDMDLSELFSDGGYAAKLLMLFTYCILCLG